MTKAKIKNIYYIGDNEDYFEESKLFFKKAGNKDVLEYHLIQLENLDDFLKKVHLNPPTLIIIDYCHDKYQDHNNPNLLRIIHQYHPYKSVPIVGIVKNEIQCQNCEFLFRYGISLIHIAGNDFDQFLQNAFYIIYESPLKVSKYALAKGFELPYQISNISFITSFNQESFSIDNDIGNESEIMLQTHFLPDSPILNCPVIESYGGGMGSCTYYNHLVKIPFASGWDDEYDYVLEEDTFIAWKENHQDEFLPCKSNVVHYSKSIESTILSQKIDHQKVYYNLYYEYNGKDKEIYKINPKLIIYEITDEKSQEQLHALLSEYTYNADSSEIIYLIINGQESSQELREQYNYEKIIATNKLPHIDMVNKIVESHVTVTT